MLLTEGKFLDYLKKKAAGTWTGLNKFQHNNSSQMTEPKIRLDLSSFLKLLDSNNGRDKLSKFIQYSARFIKWELERFHPERKELMTRFVSLEKGTANARKLVRLFRSLSYLQKIYQTVVNKKVLLTQSLLLNSIILLFSLVTSNLCKGQNSAQSHRSSITYNIECYWVGELFLVGSFCVVLSHW
jgi:hypothetical protein